MLDDDDDPEIVPGEAKRYLSVRPSYRSDEVSHYKFTHAPETDISQAHQLYLDIDTLTDPDPDKAAKATARRRPEDPTEMKQVDPPVGNTLKTKLRAWQVKPELRHNNPHWLVTQRVLANGIAWGDAEDPVLNAAPANKRKKTLHQPRGKPKKPRLALAANLEIAEAESCLDALTAGDDEDDLFAVGSSLR